MPVFGARSLELKAVPFKETKKRTCFLIPFILSAAGMCRPVRFLSSHNCDVASARMLWHLANVSLHGCIFYKDKEGKRRMLKATPSLLGGGGARL